MKRKQGLCPSASELNLLWRLFPLHGNAQTSVCILRSFPIASGAAFSCCTFEDTETYCLYVACSCHSRRLQSCSGWPRERLKSVTRWVPLLRSLEKWLFWPSPRLEVETFLESPTRALGTVSIPLILERPMLHVWTSSPSSPQHG